mmetsp:Transcript_15719/g.40052  ORF Transcript_15719/g.40052 Transcript_15719/m.40052 type:complete len:214 (-) Transcript_15719:891-1532(-)
MRESFSRQLPNMTMSQSLRAVRLAASQLSCERNASGSRTAKSCSSTSRGSPLATAPSTARMCEAQTPMRFAASFAWMRQRRCSKSRPPSSARSSAGSAPLTAGSNCARGTPSWRSRPIASIPPRVRALVFAEGSQMSATGHEKGGGRGGFRGAPASPSGSLRLLAEAARAAGACRTPASGRNAGGSSLPGCARASGRAAGCRTYTCARAEHRL